MITAKKCLNFSVQAMKENLEVKSSQILLNFLIENYHQQRLNNSFLVFKKKITMLINRIRYNCKMKNNHITFLKTYFQREQLRMVVVLMKMVGKDAFIQVNANAVQKKITDKAMDEVIERYYETAVNHFMRVYKEWRQLQKD